MYHMHWKLLKKPLRTDRINLSIVSISWAQPFEESTGLSNPRRRLDPIVRGCRVPWRRSPRSPGSFEPLTSGWLEPKLLIPDLQVFCPCIPSVSLLLSFLILLSLWASLPTCSLYLLVTFELKVKSKGSCCFDRFRSQGLTSIQRYH